MIVSFDIGVSLLPGVHGWSQQPPRYAAFLKCCHPVSVIAQAGLYFSCVARGPNLFAGEAHELKAIQETFGEIPIAGFFGNGEISHDRVYGYTGVLTLFV
jgi:small ligand-binding sensory domain FIST